MTKSVSVRESQDQSLSAFANIGAFESAQRMATALASSQMVPFAYQNKTSNCLVAIEMAQRCGVSPLMVMQNLNMIRGKPSWSSTFVIGAINSCGKFSESLSFEFEELGAKEVDYVESTGEGQNRQKVAKRIKINDKSCIAVTKKHDGTRVVGPKVSVEMAVKEGWYTKSDSKWPTMTDLMLSYRAAAFFGRLHVAEKLMGMQSTDEARDIIEVESEVVGTEPIKTPAIDEVNEKIRAEKAAKAAPRVTAKEGAPEPQPLPVKPKETVNHI